MNTALTVVIAVLVVGWILLRQMQARPLKDRSARVAIVLAAVGLAQTVQYLASGGEVGAGHAVAVVLGLIIAVALAYPRALTTKVFPGADGRYLRQGTAATIGMWILAIVAHIMVDVLVPLAMGDHTGRGFAGVTTMLFIGTTLYAQSYFLQQRVAAHRAQPTTVQVG